MRARENKRAEQRSLTRAQSSCSVSLLKGGSDASSLLLLLLWLLLLLLVKKFVKQFML